MIFACISDEAGKTRIIEAIRICQKPHVYRRLMTIQLSAEGKKVSELTDIFFFHPSDHSRLHSCLQPERSRTVAAGKEAGTAR